MITWPVLSPFVSQLTPPRKHLQICNHQDFALALDQSSEDVPRIYYTSCKFILRPAFAETARTAESAAPVQFCCNHAWTPYTPAVL
jgi:hypothetical protein